MYYIGIDLGTSAVKLLLVREDGKIENSVSKEYPLSFPHPGWSEQEPSDWWKAVKEGLKELLEGFDTEKVRAIGCGGQMHGLVILDDKDEVIRPAILWNDGRTKKETDCLNTIKELSDYTANIAFAGFTAPKILWVRENEPENFRKIRKIMLPKDYISYKLTGSFVTDYSDASGMLLLDVKNKKWSKEMLEICSVREDQLPELHESYDVIGTVNNEELPFLKGVKVVAGAGDNAAAAVGTNTLKDGSCNISLGTSGTIFIADDSFVENENHAIHNFAHASGRYHLMGCMLSAASCNKWFTEEILKEDTRRLQEEIREEKLGHNTVYFLPYLMGERSPINDTEARACFFGMDMSTSRGDMLLAVFEGVAFALRDSLEVIRSSGVKIERSNLCGGGAKSPLWRRILASVLDLRIDILEAEEGPGYGGAMLGMTADGRYASIEECAEKLCHVKETVEPDPKLVKAYEERYQIFKKIYPALKDIYKEL